MALCAFQTAPAAQEPSLETVLSRAATYVKEFNRQLSSIVAEESYVQSIKSSSNRWSSATTLIKRRTLTSDFLLVKPPGFDRFVEFRDVFEVDGRAVRDRQERLTKLFLDNSDSSDPARAIVDESARYNIGDISRNVNTPMLPLVFLQSSYQKRFTFKREDKGQPNLTALTVAGRGGPSRFRVTTEMWVIGFRERDFNTLIRTNEGRDYPAAGRFWIDPETGAVLMSELVMEGRDVEAVINVSYQSEPILGFRVPLEMRERYRSRDERVEGVASYGRFRQFQVRTDEQIGTPDAPPPKPPGTKPPPDR